MRDSSHSCSEMESTSFSVETWCQAPPAANRFRRSERASDDSTAGVESLDGIHQPGNGLEQRDRLPIERLVAVLEPGTRVDFIAADDGIEGTSETHE